MRERAEGRDEGKGNGREITEGEEMREEDRGEGRVMREMREGAEVGSEERPESGKK